MSYTPFARAESLRIGTVDFVSPDEVKVLLDVEAPDSVAMNAGGVRPFPRVNGYILMPVDGAYLVGQIEWLTVERSAFPKRRGVQDFGVVDLPYPLRRMRTNPLGTLRKKPGIAESYEFQRGADALPTIGTPVLVPTEVQLRAIVESGDARRVRIGISPLAADATVRIDPDRLFGRHLAVLGNTGSGKSCSVAGLIRWSLEAARKSSADGTTSPNARFIVLDPNGEYARAFSGGDDPIGARVFRVNGGDGASPLRVPLWFWNSAEWASFTQASGKVQRPLLRRALREVKAGRSIHDDTTDAEIKLRLRRYLSSTLIVVLADLRSGAIKTESSKVGNRLKAYWQDLTSKADSHPGYGLEAVHAAIKTALQSTYQSFVKDGKTISYYSAFAEEHILSIVDTLKESLSGLGGVIYPDGPDEDIPLRFNGVELADHLQILAEQENATQFVDFLVARIRTFLSDGRIRSIVESGEDLQLADWLDDYLGYDGADSRPVTILDLSLVPAEIIHTVIAVTVRVIFEALQRYRKLNVAALPTVLVMEEAHTFVKRYKDDIDHHDASTICCQVFERVAREGRKFGLGLVLSSQRPSELSPTVLSQCNTFLLHRISNDRDQELVHRLVPDNLRGLLRELPSLPSQNAILLGWASELPVLVKMDDLPRGHQPRSDDPDFWHVWTGLDGSGHPVARPTDWERVVDDWQGSATEPRRRATDASPLIAETVDAPTPAIQPETTDPT
jgi:DNA helicase HerA-like ATPase